MPPNDEPKPDYVRILDSDRHEYYARYLGEKRPAEDQKLDPRLQELLKKLYDRQRAEASKLVDMVEQRLNPDGESRESLKRRDVDFQRQYQRFAEERERYIREYKNAETLREQQRQREQDRALQPEKGRSR